MSGEVARLRNTRQLLRLGEMELWTRDEGVLGLGRWSSGTGTMELRDRDDGAPVPGRLSSGTGTIELRSRGALAPPEVPIAAGSIIFVLLPAVCPLITPAQIHRM